jgi:hypothetical protein
MRTAFGVIGLFLLSFSVANLAIAKPKTQTPTSSAKGVAAIENNFATIGELLDGLVQMHLVRIEEKKAVLDVLAKHKLSVSTKLAHANVDRNEKKISWGRVSLAIEELKFKTQAGVYFHFGPSSTFDSAFTEAFDALLGVQKTTVFNLALPSARAAVGDMDPAISAAAYAATYHAVKTLTTAFYTLAGGTLSLTGYPIEYFAVELWNRHYKNTVTCDSNHDYVIHGGFEHAEWLKAYKEWEQTQGDTAHSSEGFGTSLNGYSSNVYALFMAGRDLYSSSISPKEAPTADYVSSIDILSVWPDAVVPECSPANADKVQAKIVARAQKMEAVFAAIQASSTKENSATPDGKVR